MHTQKTRTALCKVWQTVHFSTLLLQCFTLPIPFSPSIHIMYCDMTASWQPYAGFWYVMMQMIKHPRYNLQNRRCYWEIEVLITALNHQTSDALMAVFTSDFSAVCGENHTQWARAQGEQSLLFNQCPSLLTAVIMGLSGASKIGCAIRSLMGECEIRKA